MTTTRHLLAFVFLFSPSWCAEILGLFPIKLKSHYIIFDSIMTELARRGHNVTVVNVFPKSNRLANFTDIDVSVCDELPDEMFILDQAYKEYNTLRGIDILFDLAETLEPIVKCENLQNLIRSDQSFDLIITEIFYSDVMLALGEKFKAPIVSFVATPLYPWAADRIGNPNNPACVRFPFSDYPMDQTNPTFGQRFWNTVYHIYGQFKHYSTNLRSERMAEKYFQNKIPVSEIAKRTSLILTFSHFSLNAPVPLLPNVIEISGVQIKPVKPLPKDLQNFIDESPHGVVYFCMGSLLRMDTLSDYKRTAFLDAFAKIPQRIVWKWGSDTLPGKSDKIFTSSWMPQRDILAHPKVKLFISHGGALGINEAVYEGVPILGIPMYGDQLTNLEVLRSHGAAEILHFTDINNDTVLNSIQQVLDKKYSANMKKLSSIFKDRPLSPMDTAIYWLEYVLRHKGAPHLRSIAADMPFYKYLLLDIIFSAILTLFALFLAVYLILRKYLSQNRSRFIDSKKQT